MAVAEFDLAVIGAGPGGAACALASARSGLCVLLVDPQGDVFDKPCGEGLMPSGMDALAELGLPRVPRGAASFRRLRFVHQGRDALEIELEAEACALARPALLAELSRALRDQAGVTRVHAHAHTAELADGFEIRTQPHAGRAADVVARARMLVAADGSGGRAAAWLRGAPRRGRSQRLGIRARFESISELDVVEIHIDRGVEVYLTPLAGGVVNAAVLLDGAPPGVHGAEALCDWALGRHRRARARLGRVLTPPTARGLDRAHPACVARDDTYLVGDAAGAVDPILGCGISLALQSGIAAAQAARARHAGATADEVAGRYRREWRAMSTRRIQIARGLRCASAHPRLAAGILALLRRSPALRRRLCRVVGGEAAGLSRL